jgi:hypothetical protein
MKRNDYPDGLGPDDPVAGDDAHTDHTGVSFTLKEGPRGERWAMVEPDEPGLPVLKFGDAFLGLHFRKDVPFAQAVEFTKQMGAMFDRLSYTKFDT